MPTGIVRRGVTRLLAAVVEPAGEATLERWFGRRPVLAIAFRMMARSYRPEISPGFHGTVVYTLTQPATDGPDLGWSVDVWGSRAVASHGVPGPDSPVAVRVRTPLADFVRIGAGLIDPAEPMLAGRGSFTGELGLAARLPEMFGAPSPI